MTHDNLSLNLSLSATGQQTPRLPWVSDAQRTAPVPRGAVPDPSPRSAACSSRPDAQDDFFTRLFLRYEPVVRAYATRRLSTDRDAAQDVVQIVFLRAWRWRLCLGGLTPHQHQAWLVRTAQRCVVDVWRERRSRHDVPGARRIITFTHLVALYGSESAQGAGEGDTPDERVERALAVASQHTLSVQQRALGMGLDEAVCTRLVARDGLTRLLARLAPEEARLLLRVGAGATIGELQAESARRGAPASSGAIKMRVKRARASARRVWAALTADSADVAGAGLDACAGKRLLKPADEQALPLGAEHSISRGGGKDGDHPHHRINDPARIGGVA